MYDRGCLPIERCMPNEDQLAYAPVIVHRSALTAFKYVALFFWDASSPEQPTVVVR